MKEYSYNLWNKIKNQADIWLFFGFLLTFPLSIRKVLLFYPINRSFNEYTGAYIYLSDILLILMIITFLLYLLYNNSIHLSKYKLLYSAILKNIYLHIPLLLVVISFISIYWSQNQAIALYRSFKLFEAYLIYSYIMLRFIPHLLFHVEQSAKQETINVPHETLKNIKNCSTPAPQERSDFAGWNIFLKSIILLGVFESIIGIWQFILQHSIGISWLKESVISPDIPGVAKIILNGHTYIRAYGLFPHPNILGGFLLFSIILTWLCLKNKLFHVEQCKNNQPITKPTLNQIVPRGTLISSKALSDNYFCHQKIESKRLWLIYWILFIQAIALIFTFSKSAILGLLMSIAYIKIKSDCSTWNNDAKDSENHPASREARIVPRGTFKRTFKNNIFSNNAKKLFHACPAGAKRLCGVEQLRRIILFILVLLALLIITKPNINVLLFKSLNERLFYLIVSHKTIANNAFFGIGAGQFVSNIPIYTKGIVESWQFQPVHNVFLLIWSELGIVGLGLFIWLLWKLFHACPAGAKRLCGVEQSDQSIVPRGTIGEVEIGNKTLSETSLDNNPNPLKHTTGLRDNTILCNDNYVLSIRNTQTYFQGILLGFTFIMLFDHYLWDIWPGQVLFWLVAGIIVGLDRNKIK